MDQMRLKLQDKISELTVNNEYMSNTNSDLRSQLAESQELLHDLEGRYEQTKQLCLSLQAKEDQRVKLNDVELVENTKLLQVCVVAACGRCLYVACRR